MRPLAAHCHLGLGRSSRHAGGEPEARQHLVAAATMYREMGMASWLELTERELAAVR
jgi:hypothetical protein